jgi:predicted GNAT family acetyltransferase
VLPEPPPGHVVERARQGRVFLWEDGEPACLVGVGGTTPNGARVGPVYTPPERRGRGYGTTATAAVTRLLLDGGRRFTFLYTDLDNATANRIYPTIGYERVAEVRTVVFDG